MKYLLIFRGCFHSMINVLGLYVRRICSGSPFTHIPRVCSFDDHCAWFICAMNLQWITKLLQNCWTFSVALDAKTHVQTGHWNFRIRSCHECTVNDLYLLYIPVYVRYIGKVIFNTFANVMNALCTLWPMNIVGCSTDGEKKITGKHQSLTKCFNHVAKPLYMRICCGAQQLGLCIQSFYLSILDAFYSTLKLIVAYLRGQQNFIWDKWRQLPLIYDTRRRKMMKLTTCFDTHRLVNTAYLAKKMPKCRTDESWWILLLLVHEIIDITAISS